MRRQAELLLISITASIWAVDSGELGAGHDAASRSVAASAAVRPRCAPVDHLVLVAVDGVRWQDVFRGVDGKLLQEFSTQSMRPGQAYEQKSAAELLPNMYYLANARGAWLGAFDDAPISASGPNFVSLPGYLELLTGHHPEGCRDNRCDLAARRTILDEWSALNPDRPAAAFASWDGLDSLIPIQAGSSLSAIVGRPKGEDLADVVPSTSQRKRSEIASQEAYPGHGKYLQDQYTAELALRYLEKEQPALTFLALGDTDEYGHRADYLRYLRALEFADEVVGQIAGTLSRWESAGRCTALFVTTDHGRENNFRGHGAFAPESARAWLLASGNAFRARGLVRSERPRRLSDVVPTMRRLLDLPQRSGGGAGKVLTELFVGE